MRIQASVELETKKVGMKINRNRIESTTKKILSKRKVVLMQGVCRTVGLKHEWVGMNVQTSEDMIRYAELVASGR
jgi:hypothetical protein